MLAAALARPSEAEGVLENTLKMLRWPVLATPKIDGIRLLTMDWPAPPPALSVPVCRSLKQLPNDYVRSRIALCPPGLDGEVITHDPRGLFEDRDRPKDFHGVQSDLMTEAGAPLFSYLVFDCGFMSNPRRPYGERVEMLKGAELPEFCKKLIPKRCDNAEELREFMAWCVGQGHEGICFRTFDSPYKHGRSTLRQQWLIKWKLFSTSEAVIIGFEEEMHNENIATLDALGHQVRSSHQENMVGKGRLGALVVRMGDVEFKIGTGFTAEQRSTLWESRDSLIGQLVTFKHKSHGQKDAPRLPVFIGIRHAADLS